MDASGPWLGFQATRHHLYDILLDAALARGDVFMLSTLYRDHPTRALAGLFRET